MITCIWCRKSHEVTTRFRCYKCGKTMCQEEARHIPSIITQRIDLYDHDNGSCGPVYDTTTISPIEKIMWFMRDNKFRKQANE